MPRDDPPGALEGDGDRSHLSPGMPVVRLSIGRDTLTGDPINIQIIPHFLESFSHTLVGDGEVGSAEFVLWDPGFDYLERLVIAGQEDISFSYGWLNGPQSETFKATITGFIPQFFPQGVSITLKLHAAAWRALLQKHWFASYPVNNYPRISDIVREVIKRGHPGIDLTVEETQRRYSDDAIIQREPDIQFLRRLATMALSLIHI